MCSSLIGFYNSWIGFRCVCGWVKTEGCANCCIALNFGKPNSELYYDLSVKERDHPVMGDAMALDANGSNCAAKQYPATFTTCDAAQITQIRVSQ